MKIKQDEILKLMTEGWELWMSVNGVRADYCIQKNGACRGGDTKNCHGSSIGSLQEKGKIRVALRRSGDAFWLTRFELTTPNPK